MTTPGPSGDGVVSGAVLFRGAQPEPARKPVTAFPECRDRVPYEPIQLADGRVRDAFVWISSGITGTYPVPAEPVTLDQRACEYVPRVLGVRAGQAVRLLNSDAFLHNVHALPGAGGAKGSAFNVTMPNRMERTERFDEPRVPVTITCDVHPWMRAYAGVVAHPFFAVTGPDGQFSLRGLPAGRYLVEAWHERLGRARQEVSVVEGGSAAVELELPGAK